MGNERQQSLTDQDYLYLSQFAYMDMKVDESSLKTKTIKELANEYLLKDALGNYIKDSEGNYQLCVEGLC